MPSLGAGRLELLLEDQLRLLGVLALANCRGHVFDHVQRMLAHARGYRTLGCGRNGKGGRQ